MVKIPLNMILKTTSFLLHVSVKTCTQLKYSLPGIWTHTILGVLWSTMLVENILKERLKFNPFAIQVSVMLLLSMLNLVHTYPVLIVYIHALSCKHIHLLFLMDHTEWVG